MTETQDESSELFEPELLMKEYMKKVKGKGKKEQETKIDNSLKGLYDYLTAPNIKKKLKNLLFFALRFSNCVKVYIAAADSGGVSVVSYYKEKRAARQDLISNTKAIRSRHIHMHTRGGYTRIISASEYCVFRNKISFEPKSKDNSGKRQYT